MSSTHRRSAAARLALGIMAGTVGLATMLATIVGTFGLLGGGAVLLGQVASPSPTISAIGAFVIVYLVPIPAGAYVGARTGVWTWRRLTTDREPDST